LQGLLQNALASGGIAAQVSWEQAGQLGTALLLEDWPEFLPAPAAAFLRRSPRKPFGLELAVDLEGALEVQEYGEDLRRFLMGEQRLAEVQSSVAAEAEPVEEEPPVAAPVKAPAPRPAAPAPVATPTPAPAPVATPTPVADSVVDSPAPVVDQVAEAPTPVAPPAPVAETPASESTSHQSDASVEEQPVVEVIQPGTRVAPAQGRTWSQAPDDLFGLAGEIHPDDQAGHGLELTTADLPWLNPGDSVISPRRGPCRIKRVEDEARQVVAKDENKQMIVITFRELLAEFQFDDGN
jgi:hypothetical protein